VREDDPVHGQEDEGDTDAGDTGEQDPFDSLVLDESFVADATRTEAPAAHRAPTRPVLPPEPSRRRSKSLQRLRRDLVPILVAVAIVVVGLVVAAFDGVGPLASESGFRHALHLAPRHVATAPSAPTSTPASSTSTTDLDLADRTYRAGECITWNQSEGGQNLATPDVPCTRPHLMEMTDKEVLTSYGSDAPYPGPAQWGQIDTAECGPPAERYLGYPLDPYGRFAASALEPTARGWGNGDRTLWCGIQLATPFGAPTSNDLIPFTGPVRGQDQTPVYVTGTCLSLGSSGTLGNPVPCTSVHSTELVGTVTITGVTSYPSSTDQWWAAVGAGCTRLATQYTGGSFPGGVRPGYLDFAPASWNAGRRTVECTVGWYDADGTLTTGSATPLRAGSATTP